MASYPGGLASFAGFTSSHTLATDNHAAQHNLEQGEILATQTKIGTGSSTPTNNKVLRGNGTGTSTWAQVALTTDVTGVLPVANGGTGQANLTTLPLISPAITGTVSGGATYTTPILSTPTIADFTSATHNHQNAAGGGQLTSSAFADGAISAANLATNAITLGISQITTPAVIGTNNVYVDAGISVTINMPTGGRNLLLLFNSNFVSNSAVAATGTFVSINEGATVLNENVLSNVNAAYAMNMDSWAYVPAPIPGSHTYKIQVKSAAAANITVSATATSPASLLALLV